MLILWHQVPEYLLRSITIKVAPNTIIRKLPSVEQHIKLNLLIRIDRLSMNSRGRRSFYNRVLGVLPILTCSSLLLDDEILLACSLLGHETFVEEGYQKLVLARRLIWLVFKMRALLGRVTDAVRIFIVQSPGLFSLRASILA